ncbi:hypothetical protein PybrP1_012735 [[Pythium] brassicae (nom. inval.)]|nr:hypothetical protein PybrP1_012735 [[Pythium] brassicae (nom. inval.)]
MVTTSNKRLAAHVEAALGEVERLADDYRVGIERLERNTRAGLSADGVRQWFAMFLRVVDLGVQIRRGEIRHRTARQFVHPCMHTTGTKGAIHSGLSIDDANGVYQALEHTPGVSESRLEGYFMRIDALDKDLVGVLDIRLNKCLNSLLGAKSASYHALETTGSDPHQELLLKGARGVEVIRRTCFRPATCACAEDAEPWRDFEIRPETGPTAASFQAAHPHETLSAASSATFISAGSIAATEMPVLSGADDDDVGLSELKRQFGFEPMLASDGEESSMELLKRRRLTESRGHDVSSSLAASAPRRLTPMQIYCRENGVEPKKRLRDLFVVTNGALNLDLSQIGFHSPENLRELLEVVRAADLPIVSLDVTNNFFNSPSFQIFCELLRLPNVVQHVQKLVLRCMALPQRSDFPTLLRILSSSENGGLVQLRELDLSYNTFSEDSVLCLDALLTGLKRLEKLSLESCFTKAPDPEVVEVAVVKDLVRTALATCCNQLKSLNFGSNWMSFPLLNSLFAPESALQELSITQMTFFCFATAGFDASMWDFNFQHLESLTLSETKHSRSDYLPVFLEVLQQSFSSGFIQLKHLDLAIRASPQHNANQQDALPLDVVVTSLLQQIGAYGALQTLRIRMECPISEIAGPHYERVLAELPKIQKLKLSIVALEDSAARNFNEGCDVGLRQLAFADAFRSALGTVREFTLEVKVQEARRAEILSDQLVHELSEAWRALSSQAADAPAGAAQQAATREMTMTKRKIRRTRNSAGRSSAPAQALATFVLVFSMHSTLSE